jgi:NADH dehydrogenase
MASLGRTQAVASVFGMRLTGFPAWWLRRTYYLFQMPRWDRRLRMILDWTVALFFRPDVTKVELTAERNEMPRDDAVVIAPEPAAREEAALGTARSPESSGAPA